MCFFYKDIFRLVVTLSSGVGGVSFNAKVVPINIYSSLEAAIESCSSKEVFYKSVKHYRKKDCKGL